MLVVRRRANESILIGNDIEVEILEVSGSQVKLGIKAPRDISVIRREVMVTSNENQFAADPASDESVERLIRIFG